MRFLATLMACLIVAQPVLAQDTDTEVPNESTDSNEVVVQMKGQPAPFDGLLVPEGRFTELVDAEIEVEKLEKEKIVEQQHSEELEKVYDEQMEEMEDELDKATAPDPWYKTPTTNRWIGFVVGVAVTVLAVFAGAKIVKSND